MSRKYFDSETSKYTAELIESGKYYEDVRGWYSQLYIYPMVERVLIATMLVVCCVCGLIVWKSIDNIYPLNVRVPFNVYSSWDSDEYYPELIKLANDTQQIEKEVAEYMLINYTVDRETYLPYLDEKATRYNEDRHSRVLEQSSKRMKRIYRDIIDPYNYESPFFSYDINTERIVDKEEARVEFHPTDPYIAYVYFKVIKKHDGKETKSNWVSEITYSIPDLVKVLREKKPIRLSVKKYIVTRIN